jgi:hypothetical protein
MPFPGRAWKTFQMADIEIGIDQGFSQVTGKFCRDRIRPRLLRLMGPPSSTSNQFFLKVSQSAFLSVNISRHHLSVASRC